MSNVWTDPLRVGKGKIDKGSKAPAKTSVDDLLRAAGKTPEVVVQISASTTKDKKGKVTFPSPRNAAALSGLVNYVSRVSDKEKDDLEMTDELGLTYTGRAELEDAIRGWNMPESSNQREVIHVVMSMPRDAPDGSLTNVAAVERAATKTANKLFKGHSFLITHHRDGEKGNPHAHILVRMEPKDGGKRLNPRRNDLQIYRKTYAHELRELNVKANATTARQRFSRNRNISQASEQMYKSRNKAKNELAASMGVTPAPDEYPSRTKKAPAKPDMDQYMAHIATIKEMAKAGQKADARTALTWLNKTASEEAAEYGQSESILAVQQTKQGVSVRNAQKAANQAPSDDEEPIQSM